MVLEDIIGAAEVDSDVWTSVLTYLKNRKGDGVMQDSEQSRTRLIVAWISTGGDKSKLLPEIC